MAKTASITSWLGNVSPSPPSLIHHLCNFPCPEVKRNYCKDSWHISPPLVATLLSFPVQDLGSQLQHQQWVNPNYINDRIFTRDLSKWLHGQDNVSYRAQAEACENQMLRAFDRRHLAVKLALKQIETNPESAHLQGMLRDPPPWQTSHHHGTDHSKIALYSLYTLTHTAHSRKLQECIRS